MSKLAPPAMGDNPDDWFNRKHEYDTAEQKRADAEGAMRQAEYARQDAERARRDTEQARLHLELARAEARLAVSQTQLSNEQRLRCAAETRLRRLTLATAGLATFGLALALHALTRRV